MRSELLPLMAALALVGCEPIDLDDCLFFDSEACEPYIPEGLTCGLAHRGADHYGGSCRLEYDPALRFTDSGVRYAEGRRADRECPEGFDGIFLGDQESGNAWTICKAQSNRERSSADLRDIPQGAVCGLSKLNPAEKYSCEGKLPANGECPEGYRLRWVRDEFTDCLDEECNRLNQGQFDHADDSTWCQDEGGSYPTSTMPLIFCEVMDGCTEGNCPDYIDTTGLLCGLHARVFKPDFEPDVEDLTTDRVGSSDIFDFISESIYDDFFEQCTEHLDELDPVMVERLLDTGDAGLLPGEITCMGKPITEGCPEGLEVVCTAEFPWLEGNSYVDPPNFTGLCWCDVPESTQLLPEEYRTQLIF